MNRFPDPNKSKWERDQTQRQINNQRGAEYNNKMRWRWSASNDWQPSKRTAWIVTGFAIVFMIAVFILHEVYG